MREDAYAIWRSAVAAARPAGLLQDALTERTFASSAPGASLARSFSLVEALATARRVIVVGAGKAGAAMSAALETVLARAAPCVLEHMEGFVNVPAECVRPLRTIRVHASRPAGTNQPTAAGVAGACRMLDLVAGAGPEDMVLCLLSGGGSALLPAPVVGVSLEDKQRITRLLLASGAAIQEMNAVRKHLSRIKGGQLVRNFSGMHFHGLILSDIVGDPLDAIASGPSAADPTTFADALAVLEKYRLASQVPASALDYLQEGAAGRHPETLKALPARVTNRIIGNNVKALAAAQSQAETLGYRVLNLGSWIEGETRQVAVALAGIVRSIQSEGLPQAPPVCLLSGGETTVTLVDNHGLGGRNQEFVLAVLSHLGRLENVAVLSGGTDGEDGPTDAAGAVADADTLALAHSQALVPAAFLAGNDAYHFFEATRSLLKTGLTETNVMDVRVILVRGE